MAQRSGVELCRFERLAWLRRRHRLYSQAALDRAAGWAPQTTAQIEQGTRPPPSRDECARLDGLLGLAPGTVWTAALPVHVAREVAAAATALRAHLAGRERRLDGLDPEVAAGVRALPQPGAQQLGVEPYELGGLDHGPAVDLVPPDAVALDAATEP